MDLHPVMLDGLEHSSRRRFTLKVTIYASDDPLAISHSVSVAVHIAHQQATSSACWDNSKTVARRYSSLIAFHVRGKDGRAAWAGGTFRRSNGTTVTLKPSDVRFTPTRTWRSKRTGAIYPIAQIVAIKLPEGEKRLTLTPMLADQELDARSSGLPVYWEGQVKTERGRGYPELTGYAAPLAM